jgi:ABC-type multidrug transport system fused ATPase/permease subunit
MERVLIDGVEQGVVAVLQILIVGGWMFWHSAGLAALVLIPVPFLAAGACLYTTTARGRYKEVRQATSEMNSLLHDNISGIRQIKTYSMERGRTHTRFNSFSDRLRRATLKVMRAWSFYNPGMSYIAMLGTVLMLFFGGRAVLAGSLTQGEFIGFLTILPLFYEPVGRLHQLNQILQAGRAAADRVFDIMDAVPRTIPVKASRCGSLKATSFFKTWSSPTAANTPRCGRHAGGAARADGGAGGADRAGKSTISTC